MPKTIDEWLLEGDPTIRTLAKRLLQNIQTPYASEGLISRYLTFYDKEKRLWGGGAYSPKWISTHYTLLELRRLEIDPNHHIYQEAAGHLLDLLWYNKGKVNKYRHQDMCVVGMMLSIICYAKIRDERISDMIDYVFAHTYPDGGWNCEWERKPQPTHSSIHTTMSIVEGLAEYVNNSYSYKHQEVIKAIAWGEEWLLKKQLFLRETTKTVILPGITSCHYPQRWKYDIYRALAYFANANHVHDKRMDQALEIVERHMDKGYLPAGVQYPGRLHFQIETADKRRLTTLIALKILKQYRYGFYEQCLNKNY